MPTIRIGYSSDFSINSNGVGIGTTFAAANTKLDVVGALKGEFNVTGVTTLTAYGGFVAQRQHVNKASTIGFGTVGVGTHQQYYETTTEFTDLGGVHHGDDQYFNTLSEDLVIDDGQILNITNTDMVGFTTIGQYDPHNHSSYVCAGSLEQVSVTGHFSVPCGGTNERKVEIEGTVRFNDDLNTLEFFNGNEWRQFTYNQGQSGRGVYGGGRDTGDNATDKMKYIQIQSLGNSQYFGDLPRGTCQNVAGCSSNIRGLIGGGGNQIEYFTFASAGDAIDFGDLTQSRSILGALSSSTRGIWAGGFVSPVGRDTIDYIEISTTGNALDFGNISYSGVNGNTCLSSPTRGIIAGGRTPTTKFTDIEFITISSKGNSAPFGELGSAISERASASNGVRGVFMGGEDFAGSDDALIKCDYITISSSGNALTFGDLTVDCRICAGVSDRQRAVKIGGKNADNTALNVMDYITFSTLGNAIDFGDTDLPVKEMGACSDSHGGLGGF